MNTMNADFLIEKFLGDDVVITFVNPDQMDLVFFKLIEYTTHETAYQLIEERHIAIFRRRRYKNFDSYRIAKHRRQRSKEKR